MSTLPYYHRPVGVQPHMLGASRTQLTPLQRPQNFGPSRAASQYRIFANEQQKYLPNTTQQYALPVQRRHTGEVSTGNSQDVSNDSENLLRRKTPGGILNGAYDGTLAGQEDRHASKHILLPSSSDGDLGSPMSGVISGMEQTLPLRSPAVPHGSMQLNSAPWPNQQQHISNSIPNAISNFNPGSANPTWSNQQLQLLPVDSMLNQIPMHYSQVHHQQPNQFIPSAMQPSPQPPSSPTVSNDHGPFGPYWPNGTFVPYRPAALRDPRYYPQTRSDWLGQTERGALVSNIGSWDSSGVAPGLGSHGRRINNNPALTPSNPLEVNALNQFVLQHEPGLTPGIQGYGNQTQTQQYSYTNQRTQQSGDYFSNPNAFQHTLTGPTGISGPQISGIQGPNGQFPALEVDSLTARAQHRDEIFAWAQNIYKELIAFIHHTRKANRQGKHGNGSQQPSRLDIYPRPPRHPSQESVQTLRGQHYERSSSTSSISDRHNELPHGHSGPSPGVANSIPGLYHSKSTGWNQFDFQDPHAAYNRRHSYQAPLGTGSSSLQGPILPLDKYRTLRRTSGISVAQAMQGGYNGPISPYGNSPTPNANAMAAFEKVSQLCQESDWKWIPGLLLAGCLAYGLGDYQHAHNLYNQILEQDSK